MPTNARSLKNGVCWYGAHFGCVNTNDPNCTKCAERLAHAVNIVLHPGVQHGLSAPSFQGSVQAQ